MTALDRYLRLEAVGLWREAPEAEVREVIVSFGKSTLVLSDLKDRPLAHWALGGIRQLDGEAGAAGSATYAMSDGETLSIRDPEMVAAIAAVRRAQPTLRRQRRRRRRTWWRVLAVLALMLLVAILPGYLRMVTYRLIPQEQETELGERMFRTIVETQGAPCANPDGLAALEKLRRSVEADDGPRVRVMELGEARAVALPGNLLLLDRATVETADESVVSGFVYRPIDGGPTWDFVREAGFLADIGYIRSGHFDDAAVARAAKAAMTRHVPGALRGEYDMTEDDWAALRGICR